MRFIENEQRIDPEEAGVIRPHLSRHAVAFEQQPGTDHIDRSDDDGWQRGIAQPFPVVSKLTTQR